jgi:hypothetical protein
MKDGQILTAQQEELWDKYSEIIDTDIDSLNYYVGKIILTHENYKKLCNELRTIEPIDEQESKNITQGFNRTRKICQFFLPDQPKNLNCNRDIIFIPCEGVTCGSFEFKLNNQ